jgi:hypothetical protein
VQLTRINLFLGRQEAPLDALALAIETHPYWHTRERMRVDPMSVELRGNPRFDRLVARD